MKFLYLLQVLFWLQRYIRRFFISRNNIILYHTFIFCSSAITILILNRNLKNSILGRNIFNLTRFSNLIKRKFSELQRKGNSVWKFFLFFDNTLSKFSTNFSWLSSYLGKQCSFFQNSELQFTHCSTGEFTSPKEARARVRVNPPNI